MNRTKAATSGFIVPLLISLGLSTDTSYRFMRTHLGITGTWELALLCGGAEAMILALSIYSWATQTKGPARLAYCVVLVQAVPAFGTSSVGGGITRVFIGPVALSVTLHFLLGLEVRMSGARPDSVLRAALREMRERVTAYLGIGRRGADSAAIARSRAADRAVVLADLVASVGPGSRRYRSRTARLAAAIDDARHGLDPEAADTAEAAIVGRIIRRKSVAELATIEDRHNWTGTLAPRNLGVPALAEHAELSLAPAVPAPARSRVPAELPAGPVMADAPSGSGTTPAVPGNTAPEIPQVDRPALEIVRNAGGTRADHIRALVADGVTDTGTIRSVLTASGIAVPTDRYIRRLVGEKRNTDVPQTGTGAYM